METKTGIIIILCAIAQKPCTTGKTLLEMNITEQIEEHGYPVETHEIQTQDDYLLTVFRIPHGRNGNGTTQHNKHPTLLNHGLFGSAENFIILGPNKSLAYILADDGYDVWLANARGSWHSRKHKTMDPDADKAFWKFTWHEIGVYDIPATIDYILNKTGDKSIHYVGHSQGTTSLFVMGSERPHYNEKIKVMIAMAPSAMFKNANMPLFKFLAPFYKTLERLTDPLNILELPPPFFSAKMIRDAFGGYKGLCSQNAMMSNMCKVFLISVIGFNQELFDWDLLPLVLAMFPSGCASLQALHYAQLIQTAKFEQFDWGVRENIQRYGSKTPPPYDFGKITFPVALFFADNDTVVNREDVKIVASSLPNLVENYKVPDTRFGHLEFLTAKNSDVVLNPKILDVLKKYNS